MSSEAVTTSLMHRELVTAIRDPQRALRWSLSQWEQQVRLSRRLRLLARLASAVESHGLLAAIPVQVRRHLVSALNLSRWRTRSMRWAIDRVGAALAGRGYPLVLLKGAAYLSQGLPIAAGRLPSDLDVLVPKEALDDALQRLRADGWQEKELDEHDQRYYREWSHELPPMRHPAHRMELDLHHNILPPIGRPSVDARLLLQRVRPSPWANWHVLSPEDQVLHAAAHLLCDSVLRDRLRDLIDLDGLLRVYGTDNHFLSAVQERAQLTGLADEWFLACALLKQDVLIPESSALRSWAPDVFVGQMGRRALLALLAAALTPEDPSVEPGMRRRLVDALVLGRYHLKRLPLGLLVPHLMHKWLTATNHSLRVE